jgi:predicted porin
MVIDLGQKPSSFVIFGDLRMKKLLIATAALAMVAGTAQAQSSVTVYGGMDVNMGSQEINKGGASTVQGDNTLYSGRLGFKGTEDLGGGLKAEFMLEAPITTSSGTATFTFSRASWVGLTDAKLGSIKLGKMDMTWTEGLDGTVGQVGNMSNTTANLGSDQSSTVQYTTPEFAGLSAQFAYANSSTQQTFENATTASSGETTGGKKLTSAAVQYKAGNFTALAGQTTAKIDGTYDQKETAYGVSYNFGFATVGAAQSTIDEDTNSGRDFKQTRFSVSAPVAALGSGVTAHAVYFKDSTNNDAYATIGGTKRNAVNGYKLALTKAFSKRTTGYVGYVDQSDARAVTTNDAKTYVGGIVHTF